MERIRISLSRLPVWLFSIVTILVILWLTLAPRPLGEESPKLFPGADKVVHGIMFGYLTIMMALDWQRKHHWKIVYPRRVFLGATLSALLGILIEFAQESMNMGRGFEYADMAADTIGAFVFAFLWILLQKFWTNNPN